jgi:hypothetical protein
LFCGFLGDDMGLFSGFAVDVRVEVAFVLGWRLGLCVAVNQWSRSNSVAFFFFFLFMDLQWWLGMFWGEGLFCEFVGFVLIGVGLLVLKWVFGFLFFRFV